MPKINKVDKKGLKILGKYNVLAEGYISRGFPLNERQISYVKDHCISEEEKAFLMEQGLYFDFISITHDDALRKSFLYFELSSKSHVTASFLSSLSNSRLDYRSGLSAFAIMQTMPAHKFNPNQASFCEICSATRKESNLDLTELNRIRFFSGSLAIYKTPYEISFFLEQQLKLAYIQSSKDDFFILNEILRIIIEAESNEKLTSIIKKMRLINGFSATTEQCRSILETLGFCGIIETKEHKGYLTVFTNPGLAPSKSRNSNWAYPVDFWVGGESINFAALDFWFGEYELISKVSREVS